jgi:hypothetical protein
MPVLEAVRHISGNPWNPPSTKEHPRRIRFSSDGGQLFGSVASGVDIAKAVPHPRGDTRKAAKAETPRSVLGFLSTTGDAAVYREMRFPGFANASQIGQNAQQVVPCFLVETPSIENHYIFYGLYGRLWGNDLHPFEFLVADYLFLHWPIPFGKNFV